MRKQKVISCSQELATNVIKRVEATNPSSNMVNSIVKLIRDKLNLSAVTIRRRFARPCSVRVLYESVNEIKHTSINYTITMKKRQWDSMMKLFEKDDSFIFYKNQDIDNSVVSLFDKAEYSTILVIPFFSNGEFRGSIEFADTNENRVWSDEDIRILKEIRDKVSPVLDEVDSENDKLVNNFDKDYITGLNRYETFVDVIDKHIAEINEEEKILLVYADVNHFKLINENYGYRRGDEILKCIGDNIIAGREYIDACRVYSDNFIIAYKITNFDVDYIIQTVQDESSSVGRELKKICSNNHIKICCGVCLIENDTIDASTAIAHANIARKKAKDEKGHQCVVFENDMIKDMQWRAYINNELPAAILKRNLVVYYQPKISCVTGHLFGAEALIRWQRDDGTFIYPDQFIPEFESNGNIISLDYYVFEEVFRYLRGRLDDNLPIVPISMNVSRLHLNNDDILRYIQVLINKYNVPTKYIEFELTENIYMQNMEPAQQFIITCNDLGISVSMDDFGSGYSSLNVLSDLKIDVLKIDKIFMKNEILSANDKIVLNSVIDMAKRLHMLVLCEGVETEEQVQFLKEAGCDVIQGYYYGKPMNQSDFDKFVYFDFQKK